MMGVGYAALIPLAFSRAASDPHIPPGQGIAARPGGVLLCSVPHPFREAVDDETGRVVRPYRDRSRRTIEIDDAYDAEMVVFDRSVGELHRALVDARFAVERIVEPDPAGEGDSAGDATDERSPADSLPKDVRFWARLDA